MGHNLNVMSLMGVVMLAGIALSNSILIVEFAHHLNQGRHESARGNRHFMQGAAAADPDDLVGNGHRALANGTEVRRRKRVICSSGAGANWCLTVSVLLTIFWSGGISPGLSRARLIHETKCSSVLDQRPISTFRPSPQIFSN